MHVPVLPKEVLQYLDPEANENFIDCNFGEGGHSRAILEKIAPRGKILGIDWSAELIRKNKAEHNLILTCDNFANLKEIVKEKKFERVNGILFDLGYASWHLTESGRGFSFQKKEPLDMRYSPDNQLTAEKILNYWSKFDIERILREYGEEKFAGEIAENIVEERKKRVIGNTLQLAEIVNRSVRGRQKIHPATRTFQALRIAVNDELNNLQKALPQAQELLQSKGRLVIISFHSLEDRVVKNFLRQESDRLALKILTKKPITPSLEELRNNPRSRSAKLRAAQKI